MAALRGTSNISVALAGVFVKWDSRRYTKRAVYGYLVSLPFLYHPGVFESVFVLTSECVEIRTKRMYGGEEYNRIQDWKPLGGCFQRLCHVVPRGGN